ncbi:MAG TPA: DUF4097 family beta strand repeat-containing protein [Gemmatimonas sp.]|nr:DUF4097 family beta strand repeat-containing protein [Gemmatimonas sp.]
MSAAAQAGNGAAATATQPITPKLRGFRVTPDVTMRIYVPAGRIRLATWARDSIAVSGSIGANASLFGGSTRTHVKFGVEARMTGDSTLPRAELTITIPRAARVWIKMIDGDIDARGTTGELEAYVVRGSIAVHDASGVIVLESIDAPVDVERTSGDLRVRGSKGRVTLRGVSGTASVATVSGLVSLADFTADGRVETIGGDVTLLGGSLGGATLDVQTHSGNIALGVMAARSPVLDVASRAGPVKLPPLVQSAANGRITARSFKGRIVIGTTDAVPNVKR